ncbi:MAG: DNA-protecting protein DprA [Candidatus Rokubacteria bacterium]|nr:DNA-protecting protein DprA [Candidatus Rokubacteria bacterium]
MATKLAPSYPAYPPLLAAVARPPDLYVRGRVTTDDALAIAIVGSRKATPYGLATAEQLAGDLAARGVTIVSGLARGIDAAAHRGALAAGGRTIAVLGCGIDIVYPPEHAPLAREIEQQGAVVSQFAPGTPPLRQHFPMRNAVIAGLSLGVVVVEAAERSGALITARLAGDLGREVYAVPGRVSSAQSRGAHGLLQDGAKLVGEWTDVVQELPEAWRRLVRDMSIRTGDANRPAAPGDDGYPAHDSRVMDLLRPDEPQHIDDLIEQSGLAPARLAAELVRLELEGRARQMAGQRWLAVTAAPWSARRT